MANSPYAEVPEPLKKQLPLMFDSYPKLDACNPSSWFTWTGDKVVARNARFCHAEMSSDGVGWDNLITAVPKNDELSLEYLRMLIRGPFRSMSDLISLNRIRDKYYLHCLQLDKWPANVLLNFCIASRIPIEFDFLLAPWAKRCEAGFEPTLAFLLTYSYGQHYSSKLQFDYRSFNIYRSGHMWLDPASNWMNILHGLLQNVSKPFKTHPKDCKPTNTIWGRCEDYKKLIEMTDEDIAGFYTQPIEILKPPPLKASKKKYSPQFMALQFNAINDGWGQAQGQPQPEHEVVHDPEDDFEPNEPPDEWFEPDNDN